MSFPEFDDSRIKDYPDKKLLEYIRAYYKPFISGDSDAQKALQTEDFVITDIPLGFIRIPREQWHAILTSFATLLTNVHITAIALYGSSKPGEFSLLEHLTEVTLAEDPPPGAAEQLPPWNKEGRQNWYDRSRRELVERGWKIDKATRLWQDDMEDL